MFNIVFYLSNPVDFYPVYDYPIPIELFDFDGFSVFGNLYRQIFEIFPQAEYYLIGEGLIKSPDFYPGINKFNFPSGNPLARLILFTAFSIAYRLNPFTVFLPSNIILDDPEILTTLIKNISENPVSLSAITLISGSGREFPFYIEASEIISRSDELTLNGIKKFITLEEIKKIKETGSNDVIVEKYFGRTGILTFNSMKFGEIISSYTEDLGELFYLLVQAWIDGKSVQTSIREIIKSLTDYNLYDIFSKTDDKFMASPGIKFKEIASCGKFPEALPLDSQGNYILGGAFFDRVFDSIIINKSNKPVILKNLNQVLVLSRDGTVKIEGLIN